MRERYRRWMHEREVRMTSRDNNRVVRPFEWGRNGRAAGPPWRTSLRRRRRATKLRCSPTGRRPTTTSSPTAISSTLTKSHRISAWKSARWNCSTPGAPKKQPKDELGTFLRFTSPVESPYAENNGMNARWFPARGRRRKSRLLRFAHELRGVTDHVSTSVDCEIW